MGIFQTAEHTRQNKVMDIIANEPQMKWLISLMTMTMMQQTMMMMTMVKGKSIKNIHKIIPNILFTNANIYIYIYYYVNNECFHTAIDNMSYLLTRYESRKEHKINHNHQGYHGKKTEHVGGSSIPDDKYTHSRSNRSNEKISSSEALVKEIEQASTIRPQGKQSNYYQLISFIVSNRNV